MFKGKKKLTLTLGLLALLISGILFWKTSTTYGTTDDEQFHQGLRNALAELNISTGNDLVSINQSSDNLANFIRYRSGVQLSQANKDLLRTNEQKAWDQSKRITQTQLAQILTDVAFDKLITLSDSDINNMAETLRGFNSPGLSANYQSGRGSVRLRADGEGTMEPSYFASELKLIRDGETAWRDRGTSPDLESQIARSAFYNSVLNYISRQIGCLKDASPSYSEGSPNDMTPVEAVLLTYSVVTNDMIMDNQSELQQRMVDNQSFISQYWQDPYPSPQGHRAYGENGYIYSTPANLLLDDPTVTRVLNLIKERSNLQ